MHSCEHFGTAVLFARYSVDRPVSASLDWKNVVASLHHSWQTNEALAARFLHADRIVDSRRMPAGTGGDSAADFEAEFGLAGMSKDRRHV